MAKAAARPKKISAKSKPSGSREAKPAPLAAARKALKKRPAKPGAKATKKQTAAAEAAKPGKWVYTFGDGKAEGKADLRDLLGGKGANLAEMASLGLPVPPGFTIPTSVCSYFYAHDKSYPKDLKAQLEKQFPPEVLEPIAKAIDAIMAGQIVDPPPPGLSIAPSMQPGIASAFTEDPIDPLKLIDRPILIVGGGRDRQVARLDFVALSTAAPLAKALWLPDMNHVLVDVADPDDDLAAYSRPERALDTAMIDSVAAFILGDDAR